MTELSTTAATETPEQAAAEALVARWELQRGAQIFHQSRRGLVSLVATAITNAVAVERERCAKDVCMYCGGCCPTHETQVEGPNSAGNYTHRPRSGYAAGGGGPRLCSATSLWSRHRYEIAEAASKSEE